MSAVEHVQFELDSGPRVIVRDMLTITRATDLFLGDLTRRGYSQRTVDTYQRLLDQLADRCPVDHDIGQVTEDDCRRYLDTANRKSAGTRAHMFSVLSSFFKWLYMEEKIKRNPLERMARPKRLPPEDLDVTTLSTDDVRKLLAAAETWPERLTINVLAYLGPRRRAVSRLRLRDYDRERGRLRFYEKGGKTIWKAAPSKLVDLIESAIAAGQYKTRDDYLIPPEGPTSRSGDRDDRVIWKIVKRLADRAGVDAHVHALRAAFAVYYLDQPGNDALGLQDLLGHRSFATTQVYLRKRDKDSKMESVRSLDWADNTRGAESPLFAGERFEASVVVGAGGFEPPYKASSLSETGCTQRDLDEVLRDQAKAADRAKNEVTE